MVDIHQWDCFLHVRIFPIFSASGYVINLHCHVCLHLIDAYKIGILWSLTSCFELVSCHSHPKIKAGILIRTPKLLKIRQNLGYD